MRKAQATGCAVYFTSGARSEDDLGALWVESLSPVTIHKSGHLPNKLASASPQVMLTRDGKESGHRRGRPRRASARSPLAGIGLEDWRSCYQEGSLFTARRSIHWSRQAPWPSYASTSFVANHSDFHAG